MRTTAPLPSAKGMAFPEGGCYCGARPQGIRRLQNDKVVILNGVKNPLRAKNMVILRK